MVSLAVASPLSAQRPTPAAAPAPAAFDLTIENIMRGPDLYGTAPSDVRFSDDSRYVYFRWKKPDVDTAEAAYRVPVTGGEPERLSSIAEDTLMPEPGVWSRDRRFKVFAHRRDIYLWDAQRGTRRRLTDTPAAESDPALSPDARTVYFVRDDNVFALALEGGSLAQLTDVRRGTAPRPPAEPTGQRRFLREQQRELFEFVRRPPPGRPFGIGTGAGADTTGPHRLYLSENQSIRSYDVSPDGRLLLFTLSERAAGALLQTLPVWVTETGYVDTRPNRAKVGDEQATTRVGIMTLLTGDVRWLEPPTDGRPADVTALGWSPSGRYALLRGTSRDFEYRWLWVADAPDSAIRTLDVLHDSAWVGPLSRAAGWLPDGSTVYFSSEASGWSHLYTVGAQEGGAPARALTSGAWEVYGVEPSSDGNRFYFQSGEVHWGERHFYVTPVGAGPARVQLTRGVGRHDVEVSPDERWLAILHSTANHPPELYIQPNRPGAAWRQVTESTTEEFRRYPWRVIELVEIPARDGARVPGRLYRPTGPPNGAAVIFVHGAGYTQNVHRWWSSYAREYMFHHFLAERGYAVLDLDYRASSGHGRDWRTAIYRQMGGKDLDDQVDGARWLVRNLGVDSSRIGIYGGSYGGFITLMAMFTAPGVFQAGAALRPVTDWAHYNHPYTAAILNEPQADSLAYRRSSPIYLAEGLRGALLICHGMVDDNVNFQDSARLVQRLIELGKENWELAVYPVEPHGFRLASSWTDEYRRIFRLFERTLNGPGTATRTGG